MLEESAGGFESSGCCVRNAPTYLFQIHSFTGGDDFSWRRVRRLSPSGNIWIYQLWSKLWSELAKQEEASTTCGNVYDGRLLR